MRCPVLRVNIDYNDSGTTDVGVGGGCLNQPVDVNRDFWQVTTGQFQALILHCVDRRRNGPLRVI